MNPCGRPPQLTYVLEDAVAIVFEQHLRFCIPLPRSDIRTVALAVAKQFLREPELSRFKAGPDWVRAFLKRHPRLRIRQPRRVSASKFEALTRETVDDWATAVQGMYMEVFGTLTPEPERVCNFDESPFSTATSSGTKVVSVVGGWGRVGTSEPREQAT